MMKQISGYALSRKWFNFCFDNPEKIVPGHTAVYFFIIEHCNRLGWKEKFGLPSTMVMEAIGIKSYNTYKKILHDLIDFGFVKMIQLSKNQYSSNIIALSNFNTALDEANDKALDKALAKHLQSTVQSIDSINKQVTIEQTNNRTVEHAPIVFFNAEEEIIKNQIRFEQICMAAGAGKEQAKESLHKYHLYLEEKEQYPKPLKSLFAGFEKWLINEKKFSKNGTNRKIDTANGYNRTGKSAGAEQLLASLKEDLASFGAGLQDNPNEV